MKGKDIVKWITENHAEEKDVLVSDRNLTYLDVAFIWDSEARGGSVMLDTNKPEEMKSGEE